MSVFTAIQGSSARSAAAPSDVLVAGAGTAAADGAYLYFGETNGKASYTPDGAGDPIFTGISWFDDAWRIVRLGGQVYSGPDAVAFPWLVAEWSLETGDPPAPVVTEV